MGFLQICELRTDHILNPARQIIAQSQHKSSIHTTFGPSHRIWPSQSKGSHHHYRIPIQPLSTVNPPCFSGSISPLNFPFQTTFCFSTDQVAFCSVAHRLPSPISTHTGKQMSSPFSFVMFHARSLFLDAASLQRCRHIAMRPELARSLALSSIDNPARNRGGGAAYCECSVTSPGLSMTGSRTTSSHETRQDVVPA